MRSIALAPERSARVPSLALGIVLGCGRVVASNAGGGEDATSSTGGSAEGESTSTTTAGHTTGADWSTGMPETSRGDEWPVGFIRAPDLGIPSIACDFWAQDCGPGEKCVAWANDGGQSWNAVRCSPIAPNPAAPGQPCVVQDHPFSGLDDCDAASMCWNVDAETLEGTCVGFCVGSESAAICTDPGTSCFHGGGGVLILCLPECDPVAQDCPDGEGCWDTGYGAFACAPELPGDGGAFGDVCPYAAACNPGLTCMDPSAVPGCSAANCCSPHCAVGQRAPCPGAGQECLPWFDPGEAPPGYEDVGVCAVP